MQLYALACKWWRQSDKYMRHSLIPLVFSFFPGDFPCDKAKMLGPIYTQRLRHRCVMAPKSNLLFWCCTVTPSDCKVIVMSLGNRFVSHSGVMSQRHRRRVAVAGCKWALKALPLAWDPWTAFLFRHQSQSVTLQNCARMRNKRWHHQRQQSLPANLVFPLNINPRFWKLRHRRWWRQQHVCHIWAKQGADMVQSYIIRWCLKQHLLWPWEGPCHNTTQ